MGIHGDAAPELGPTLCFRPSMAALWPEECATECKYVL